MYSSELYDKVYKYIYNNSLEVLLYNRLLNEKNINYQMQASELRIVADIDEYFYLLLKENKSKYGDNTLKKYLTEISKELENDPLLLLSLPIWKLDKKVLERNLSNYNKIIKKINQTNYEVNKTYKNFSNNIPITLNEFYNMIKFFTYTIPYANSLMKDAQDKVAKFILNEYNYSQYNAEITTFLIKHFGYKKINEENLKNTKIIIGSLNDNVYGESSENHIVINKKLLLNIILQNNILDNNAGKIIINDSQGTPTTGIEVLKILHTLYHELRHQKQEQYSNLCKKDDISYYYSAFELMNNKTDYDYKTNYKCYEIEKDANYKAWLDIEKLIKNYIPNKNTEKLMKNILNHKLKEELMQITGIRKTENNELYISSAYLIKKLDNKFLTNPQLLTQKYSHFLTFYNNNGNPKKVIELLKLSSIYNYKEFYFGQVSHRVNHSILYEIELSNCTEKDFINIINNIKILININQQKLNKICDRVEKENEKDNNIIASIKYYYNFAIYLSSLTSKIINKNPSLLKILSIRNSLDSINSGIDQINSNRLIIKYCAYFNKISKINRR